MNNDPNEKASANYGATPQLGISEGCVVCPTDKQDKPIANWPNISKDGVFFGAIGNRVATYEEYVPSMLLRVLRPEGTAVFGSDKLQQCWYDPWDSSKIDWRDVPIVVQGRLDPSIS